MKPGDTRRKNANWIIGDGKKSTVSESDAKLAVLMDIRDELQALNATFNCINFQSIPRKLDAIAKHTNRIKPRARKRRT